MLSFGKCCHFDPASGHINCFKVDNPIFQIAKSGLDDEEIVLMDDRGCPADPVFPGLTKENGTGALIGKFEAFKFSDSKWKNTI